MKHDMSEAVKVAALKAGIVDIDALVLADGSVKDDGSAKAAADLVAALKAAKPFLFRKHARDMSEPEREAFWREVKRRPAPEPMPTDRQAKDMSPAEREAFVRECARRFG